jgi:hypothetical protein
MAPSRKSKVQKSAPLPQIKTALDRPMTPEFDPILAALQQPGGENSPDTNKAIAEALLVEAQQRAPSRNSKSQSQSKRTRPNVTYVNSDSGADGSPTQVKPKRNKSRQCKKVSTNAPLDIDALDELSNSSDDYTDSDSASVQTSKTEPCKPFEKKARRKHIRKRFDPNPDVEFSES